MVTVADLTTQETPTWCPGCGDFTILSTLKNALVEVEQDPANTVVVSGIGCGSKLPHYVKTYGFEGLHGRALPVATGIRFANHTTTTIVVTGDGDGLGIGGNHFVHSMRRNLNLTHIIEDNHVYGLTKGQYSPTSEKGFKSPSSPSGAIENSVNPLTWALICGATFVARGYAMDVMHLKELMKQAIQHKGYALIDVLQPCPSYNKINTMKTYGASVYKLEGNDITNRDEALTLAEEWGPKIPIGVLYKVDKPTYEDSVPQLQGEPMAHKDIANIDMKQAFERYVF